jgi:replication factor C subunit 3/5
MNKLYIPWVEKYRPTSFDNIVLSETNKSIFSNILKKNYFPNMLLYGPPGTGKTTTIINLINAYQEQNNEKNKGLMIHLNASDERGIDIIRNNINNFVNSNNLFNSGTKFIILDEVDYMTKNAQQALKYLLSVNSENVRFCLICNYISRIDDSLQNEFMRLRFNQLPENEIINFMEMINKSENLNYTREDISSIQKIYKSDIRSMINYIQSNQNVNISKKILDDSLWDNLSTKLNGNMDLVSFQKYFSDIGKQYNIEKKNIIKEYLNYIIFTNSQLKPRIKTMTNEEQNKNMDINSKLLRDIELLMHQTDNNKYIINYIYFSLSKFWSVI